MKQIDFQVFGSPKGQPRPRSFARKFGNKWMARVYDPGTAEGWKSQIATAAAPFLPLSPMEGPLNVRLAFWFKRPKGHSKKSGELRDQAPAHHVQRPDCDNLEKAVIDCLTVLGFWRDDCQIVNLKTSKGWTGNAQEGVQVSITETCE